MFKKLLDYVVTHFRVQPSHPEESNKGWEIRWTFFNIAFFSNAIKASKMYDVWFKDGSGNPELSVIVTDRDGELYFGWTVEEFKNCFIHIGEMEKVLLDRKGTKIRKIIQLRLHDEWYKGVIKNGGFLLSKEPGKIKEEWLPSETSETIKCPF